MADRAECAEVSICDLFLCVALALTAIILCAGKHAGIQRNVDARGLGECLHAGEWNRRSTELKEDARNATKQDEKDGLPT